MVQFDLTQLVKGLNLLKNDVNDVKAEKTPEDPSLLWKLTHLQPALYAGFVTAIVALLASVGFVIADSTTNAIISLVAVVAACIQAFWTHNRSVPFQKVVVYKPDPVNQPSQVLAGPAVSTNVVSVANAAASTPDDPSELLPLIP